MSQLFKFLSALARLAKVGRFSGLSLVAVLVFSVAAGLTNTGLLALINNRLNASGPPTAAIIWAFVGLCVAFPLSRVLSQLLLLRMGTRAVYEMRMGLTEKILAAPMRHLEELGGHRLLAALTGDITTITNTLTDLPMLCMHIAIVAGGLAYLGWLSWPALLVVLFFMVVGFITYQIPLGRALRQVTLLREAWDTLFKNFDSLTNGLKELKLHRQRRGTFVSQVLAETAQRHVRHTVRGMSIFVLASSWGQILFFIVIGLLLFLVPSFMGVSSKTVTGYTLVLLYMMTPLEFVLNHLPDLGRANVAIRKINELGISLEENAVPDAELSDPRRHTDWKNLELQGVTHVYKREGDDRDFVLGPVDLALRPGELVFVVGGNGSGKTTLAKLLIGLYTPETGKIFLDDEEITEEKRDAYRQLFSVVFTDFHLFESLMGIEHADIDAEAQKYLARLHLDGTVRVEDGVFSTLELSQGQRKRLALLTAYMEDRPIYLFDEWAADQDPTFKEIFYLDLLPALRARGKTVVVISHDDRYYSCADRVLKLDYGQIVEDRRVA